MKQFPSRERVTQLLDYNPHTGQFRWRSGSRGRWVDRPAGTAHNKGYRQIRVDGLLYMEHWLAWLLIHGYWPKQIDHINRDKSDNRISNLREATRAQNRANSKVNKDSISGIKGVRKINSRWEARIKVGGQLIHLGRFSTSDEANQAYATAAAKAFQGFATRC